jgi:hypothetical protein
MQIMQIIEIGAHDPAFVDLAFASSTSFSDSWRFTCPDPTYCSPFPPNPTCTRFPGFRPPTWHWPAHGPACLSPRAPVRAQADALELRPVHSGCDLSHSHRKRSLPLRPTAVLPFPLKPTAGRPFPLRPTAVLPFPLKPAPAYSGPLSKPRYSTAERREPKWELPKWICA